MQHNFQQCNNHKHATTHHAIITESNFLASASESLKGTLLILPSNSGLTTIRTALEKLPNKKAIVRAEDIPFVVSELSKKGVRCVGITGQDLLAEFLLKDPQSKVRELYAVEWNDPQTLFGKPALCLLGTTTQARANAIVGVNAKYTRLAENYFATTGMPKEIISFSGCTEAAAQLNLVDFVVDIVYSGKSAKEVGLEVLDIIAVSNIAIIGVMQ